MLKQLWWVGSWHKFSLKVQLLLCWWHTHAKQNCLVCIWWVPLSKRLWSDKSAFSALAPLQGDARMCHFPLPWGRGHLSPQLAAASLQDMACGLHTQVGEMVFSCSRSAADIQPEMTIFNLRSCQWQSVRVGWWGLFLLSLQQWRTRDAHVHLLYDLFGYSLWHPRTKGHVLNVSESKTLQLLSYWGLNCSFKIWFIKWALQPCLYTQINPKGPWSCCSHLFLTC